MRRATVRAVQVGIALALLATLVPLSAAHAADDDEAARPLRLLSAQAQQPPGPAVGVGVAAPGLPPPFIYGFFRDPLWPGPGQRFLAEECPIGVGATIIHYCPGRPPFAEPLQPIAPILPPEVMQCDPWFQYFMTCRRLPIIQ
jgi:hypothetical protein